ncbi:hypothetical protein OSTOST_25776 [Ostertagia ostertagi]
MSINAQSTTWRGNCQCAKYCGNPPTHKVFSMFSLRDSIIALLLAFGEYCIESRHDTFRLQLTVLGKIRNWM